MTYASPTSSNQASVLPILVRAVASHARRTLLLGLTIGLVAATAKAMVFKQYQAQSAVSIRLPAGSAAAVGGLSQALGFILPGGSGTSLEFYQFVSLSQVVLDSVLLDTRKPWVLQSGESQSRLLDLLDPPGASLLEKLDNAREALRRRMSVSADVASGVLTVAAKHRDPQVAADIVNRVVLQMSRFDVSYERSAAIAELAFAESRLAVASDSLQAAEDSLKRFEISNRSWDQAPPLRYEHARLLRQLTLRNDRFLLLSQAVEEARLRAARDIPPIATIFEASVPTRQSGLGILMTAAVGLFVGVLLGVGISILSAARDLWPERFAVMEDAASEAWLSLRRTRSIR